MFSALDRIEAPLVRRLTRLEATRGLRLVMLAATRGADGWALLLIVPLVVVFGGGRGVAGIACGAISGVLTALIVHGFKSVLRRSRPPGMDLERPIGAPDAFAFPSGHTAHAFSVMLVAFWVEPWIGLVMAPVALATGVSRVFFGLHYPSDVVGGALLGSVMAWQVLGLAERIGLVNFFVARVPWA
jgi:membrane-associated phospholipid phosphatase